MRPPLAPLQHRGFERASQATYKAWAMPVAKIQWSRVPQKTQLTDLNFNFLGNDTFGDPSSDYSQIRMTNQFAFLAGVPKS